MVSDAECKLPAGSDLKNTEIMSPEPSSKMFYLNLAYFFQSPLTEDQINQTEFLTLKI